MKLQVLIADADPDFQRTMTQALSREGDMEAAGVSSDGLETLSLIQTARPDVVLLDLIQQRLDGLAILRRLAGREDAPPVLVLTGFVNAAVVAECAKLGAAYFIPKPCDTAATFNEGDVVTTVIKCADGETVVLTHDCSLPRPYSRGYRVQGTKGIYMEDGGVIYLEGQTVDDPNHWTHSWNDAAPYIDKYEHPLWKKYKVDGVHAGGHGGMDYLVLSAFAESVRMDAKPPIDVYDTATWMAVTALSEQSIAIGGAPVPFPDFTNGMWIDREPYRRGTFCLDEVCTDYFDEEE